MKFCPWPHGLWMTPSVLSIERKFHIYTWRVCLKLFNNKIFFCLIIQYTIKSWQPTIKLSFNGFTYANVLSVDRVYILWGNIFFVAKKSRFGGVKRFIYYNCIDGEQRAKRGQSGHFWEKWNFAYALWGHQLYEQFHFSKSKTRDKIPPDFDDAFLPHHDALNLT